MFATHHLRVVGEERLLIQWEFLWTQVMVEFDHLSKLQAKNTHEEKVSWKTRLKFLLIQSQL